MKHVLSITRTMLVASLMLLPLVLPGLTLAAESVKETLSSAEVQAHGLAQIAEGSVSDTLKLCLARIPQDASAGQLMLAEQNCQHVAIERTETSLSF